MKEIFEELEKFHADLEIEKLMAQENGITLPIVEAPRKIIEHFNRGKLLKAFDAVGYFLYQGACVCEQGKKDKVEADLDRTSTMPPAELRKLNATAAK